MPDPDREDVIDEILKPYFEVDSNIKAMDRRLEEVRDCVPVLFAAVRDLKAEVEGLRQALSEHGIY